MAFPIKVSEKNQTCLNTFSKIGLKKTLFRGPPIAGALYRAHNLVAQK